MNGFTKQNQLGKVAESAIKSILEARGNIVEDVSSVKEYQAIDVDLVVNGSLKFEVKLDNSAKRTGNIFLEVGKTRKTGFYPSWLSKCEADVIAFYDSDIKKAVFYDWKKLQELSTGYNKRSYWDNVDNCQTHFITIPKASAEGAKILEI